MVFDRLRHGRRFGETLAAVARASLLRTGIRQGLFEALREPRSPAGLAERLGLAHDLVESWLRAAHAQGLLERRADARGGSTYHLDGYVRWLLDAPEASALHAVLDQAVLSYAPVLERLPALMKGAERPEYGSAEEAVRVAAASRLLEHRALEALARVPGVRKARRVLDVGCGQGSYLAGFLTRYRDAHGLGIELDPLVAEEARRSLAEAEVSRRGEIRVGDFMTLDLPGGHWDLALLNNNLHYFPPRQRAALFQRILTRLTEHGVLAIQTAVLTDSAVARALGTAASVATFDLFLRSHRNLYGLPDLEETQVALRESGFGRVGQVAILPGGSAYYLWARAKARP